MSHFSRIFSLVAIINTSSKQLCSCRDYQPDDIQLHSQWITASYYVTLRYELSRKVAVDLLAAEPCSTSLTGLCRETAFCLWSA